MLPRLKTLLHILKSTKNWLSVLMVRYGLKQKTNAIFLKDHGVVTIGQRLLEATNLLIESADKNKPFILPFVKPLA